MIRLRSEYVEGEWRLTDKPIFTSGRKHWRKTSYYLKPPMVGTEFRLYQPIAGAKPVTIGGTCLTVWSK
jgi:hypothetical protein